MNQKRMLIVDDDPDLRLALRLPLESAGYAISEADSMAAGKNVVKEVKPDLIILDVMMDTTTAGFQFALDLHSPDPSSEFKEFRNIPIIMLTSVDAITGLNLKEMAKDPKWLPVEAYLEKPVQPQQLLGEIKRLLNL